MIQSISTGQNQVLPYIFFSSEKLFYILMKDFFDESFNNKTRNVY